MMNVAFIPVRKGSKSIPLKNIKLFFGKPLVYWTIKAAEESLLIDKIFVSTDSEEIKTTVLSFEFKKVCVIERSEQSATDTATTESAMLEFAREFVFDNIILIQATSPLLTSEDLDRGINALKYADSVLSVVRQKRFLWQQKEYATPLNYDYKNRPRRQEFDGFLVENGAFYITRRDALLETKCRLSGKIKAIEMPEDTYVEIDEEKDWIIAENLLKNRINRKKLNKKIKMFLMDCDGTLTDGSMYYTSDGKEMKKFHTYDGVGIRLLKEHGILTGIISSEDSEIVWNRGKKLKVDEVFTGVLNKVDTIKKICQKYNIKTDEIAFVGDDLNDIDVLNIVGIAICPANAVIPVKNVSTYVTKKAGGSGAVREAAEFIMENYI